MFKNMEDPHVGPIRLICIQINELRFSHNCLFTKFMVKVNFHSKVHPEPLLWYIHNRSSVSYNNLYREECLWGYDMFTNSISQWVTRSDGKTTGLHWVLCMSSWPDLTWLCTKQQNILSKVIPQSPNKISYFLANMLSSIFKTKTTSREINRTIRSGTNSC